MVVATSAGDDEVAALLARAGVDDLLQTRASKDDAARSKPNPDIVHAALSRADAEADGAVMVGDTPYDLEAANRAGIPAIALRSGEPGLTPTLREPSPSSTIRQPCWTTGGCRRAPVTRLERVVPLYEPFSEASARARRIAVSVIPQCEACHTTRPFRMRRSCGVS